MNETSNDGKWRGGWWNRGEFLASYFTDVDGYDANTILNVVADRIVVFSDMFTDDIATKEIKRALKKHKEYREATVEELSTIQQDHQLPVLMAVVRR